MRAIIRSRALWVAVGSITLAVVLLITFAPARDITHTVLGWLRVTPLVLDDDGDRGVSAQAVPAAPTPSLAEVIEVVSVEPSALIPNAAPADIDDLPFEIVEIDPPAGFSSKPTRSVTTFGTVTLRLDTAELAGLLAPGLPSRRLARRVETDELVVAGGALVVSSWPTDDGDRDALTLYQIEAPLVSGLPPRELELLADLITQAFLPPILRQQIDVMDIPMVQTALGLDVDSELRPTEPTLTELPNGAAAITWMRDRSQFVLTGPLPPDGLLGLAGDAGNKR